MGTKVLVVDANREFAILIRQSLEEGGQYSVSVANSGMEALTLAAETPFELAVIDLDLPDIQGRKVVRRLREAQPELKLVVIPESGRDEVDDEETVPVEGVLRKPFYLPDLPKILQETLESSPMPARGEHREAKAGGVADLEAQFDPEADEFQGQIPSLEQASDLLDIGLPSSGAKAALLLRDRRPIAQAGDISAGTLREVSGAIPDPPSRNRTGDLVRFLRLAGRRDDFLLYGTQIADRLNLALLFPADTPIGVARKQTGLLAQKLIEAPHEAAEVKASEEDDAVATISEAQTVEPRPQVEPEEMRGPEAEAEQPGPPELDAEELVPPEEEAQVPEAPDVAAQAIEPEPPTIEPAAAEGPEAEQAEPKMPEDEADKPGPPGVEAEATDGPQARPVEPEPAEVEGPAAEAAEAEEEKPAPEGEPVQPEPSDVEADEARLPETQAEEGEVFEAEAAASEAPTPDQDEADRSVPPAVEAEAADGPQARPVEPEPAEVEGPAAEAPEAEEEKPAPEGEAVEPEPSEVEAAEAQGPETQAEPSEGQDIEAEEGASTELEAEAAELYPEETAPPQEAGDGETLKVEAMASKPPEHEAAAAQAPETEADMEGLSEVEAAEAEPAEVETDEGQPEPQHMPGDWVPEAQLSSTQAALFEQWAELEPPEADPEPEKTSDVTGEAQTAGAMELPTDWIPQEDSPQGRLAFFDDLMAAQETETNGEAAPAPVRPPMQPTSYHLSFNAVLIPRFPEHELTGSLAEQLSRWTRRLCLAWDWRADWIRVEPQALHLQVSLIPESAPAQAVERLMQGLSERIIDRYPKMQKELPSGRFWARPYLLTAGAPPESEQVRRFLRRTRRAQGFEV